MDQGSITTSHAEPQKWADSLNRPWIGAMEATMFTGWIYTFLLPYAHDLKVDHPEMLKDIVTGKKKNGRICPGFLKMLISW